MSTFHIGDAICPLCREPVKMNHHDNLGDGESMVCSKSAPMPGADRCPRCLYGSHGKVMNTCEDCAAVERAAMRSPKAGPSSGAAPVRPEPTFTLEDINRTYRGAVEACAREARWHVDAGADMPALGARVYDAVMALQFTRADVKP
jgi:hypothetical protein